jgi:hypothetical protein
LPHPTFFDHQSFISDRQVDSQKTTGMGWNHNQRLRAMAWEHILLVGGTDPDNNKPWGAMSDYITKLFASVGIDLTSSKMHAIRKWVLQALTMATGEPAEVEKMTHQECRSRASKTYGMLRQK